MYRPDVDGLRTLAVLPVVIFHAGLGLSGGFVGVNVFFVISGYLITGIIASEIDRGDFSILRFYERRARRILPALLAMMAVTALVAVVVMMPKQLYDFGRSVNATVFFISNMFFWREINYFSQFAETMPLLHTWSLAVEEQFYIIFPVVLLVLSRLPFRRAAVWCLLLGSLATAVVVVAWKPQAAFFLAPFRAWELLAGSVLALGVGRAPKGLWCDLLGLAALAAIVVPMCLYDSETAFPGMAALPVVAGAAVLIWCGPDGLVNRWLSWRPFVGIGLLSYSLYLWHWPILAFLRMLQPLFTTPAVVNALIAIALSFALAYLSWRYIEGPFRHRQRFDRRAIFGLSGAGMAAMMVVGITIWAGQGLPGRMSPEVLALAAGGEDIDPRRVRCLGHPVSDGECHIGSDRPADFVLWGDSHAESFMNAVEVAAGQHGGAFFGLMGCAPLLGVSRERYHSDCAGFADDVIKWIDAHPTVETVILAARWAYYDHGHRVPGEDDEPVMAFDGMTPHDPHSLLERGLTRTVAALRARNKRIIVLGGVPEVGWNVPASLAMGQRWHRLTLQVPTRDEVRQRNAGVIAVMNRLDLNYIDVSDFLCRPNCLVEQAGHPIFHDDDHLSVYGSRNVVGPLLALWPNERVTIR